MYIQILYSLPLKAEIIAYPGIKFSSLIVFGRFLRKVKKHMIYKLCSLYHNKKILKYINIMKYINIINYIYIYKYILYIYTHIHIYNIYLVRNLKRFDWKCIICIIFNTKLAKILRG